MAMNYGSMYFFNYKDPKTVRKGEIWDSSPLILPLYITHRLTLSINVHWIPLRHRAQFVNLVLEATKKIKNKKKLARFTYEIMKRNKKFRPALKGLRKYINKRMTNIQEIPRDKVGKLMLVKPKYFSKKLKRG